MDLCANTILKEKKTKENSSSVALAQQSFVYGCLGHILGGGSLSTGGK